MAAHNGAKEFPNLPSGPLAKAIASAIRRNERSGEVENILPSWLGISDKAYREWTIGGVRPSCKFNTADRVLCGLGLNWFEVWHEGNTSREDLARVRFAFTGEGAGEQLEMVA